MDDPLILEIIMAVGDTGGDFSFDASDEEWAALRSGRADALWRAIVTAQTGVAAVGALASNDAVWMAMRRAISRERDILIDAIGPDYRLDC